MQIVLRRTNVLSWVHECVRRQTERRTDGPRYDGLLLHRSFVERAGADTLRSQSLSRESSNSVRGSAAASAASSEAYSRRRDVTDGRVAVASDVTAGKKRHNLRTPVWRLAHTPAVGAHRRTLL